MSEVALSGLACFTVVARHHGVEIHPDQIIRQQGLKAEDLDGQGWASVFGQLDFEATAATMTWDELCAADGAVPLLAFTRQGHWVVVQGINAKAEGGQAAIIDPIYSLQRVLVVSGESFRAAWTGEVVLCKRRYRLTDEDRPFDLMWFVPELLRQRRLFTEIAVAALALHFLGLASPLFFQLVIDKVLVHQSQSTMNVLVGGILLATLFEAVFGFLRRSMLLYASNKVDVRVSRRTFAHLLSLPIAFFETSTSGVVVKHMQQAEKVREFLTGRLFLTLLDATALIVFLPLLFFYSPLLTGIVVLFGVLIALVIAVVIRPFRQRLRDLYTAEGHRQSLLVETIHGMATVKALALESRLQRQWQDSVAQTLTNYFNVGKVSIGAQTVMQALEKLMTIAVIAVGTQAVFDGTMSVGALIAFQMLAGRVSGPLGQIVGLVHEYQETGLSIRMLGNIMNAPPERGRSGGITPEITGEISFEDVTFRYTPESEPALAGVSFRIPAGKVVGIVGRSGSGKTTITRLIQSMYTAQAGVVRLGSYDLREINVDYLRSRIGVVLQENFLFRGTVRDNILAPRPGATMAEVMAAASLAGATEFIERFPRGFDTMIEENGANLSGGQRQRLAIARALLTSPKLLIFDEATSALDPDTEVIIQNNLREMARDRTVILVTHRLNALVDADHIIVLDRGRLVGQGSHQELLVDTPIYRQLWAQQTRQSR